MTRARTTATSRAKDVGMGSMLLSFTEVDAMPMSVFLYTSMPDMMPRDKLCASPYPYHCVISVGVGRHRQSWRWADRKRGAPSQGLRLALDQAGFRLRL